MRTKTLLLSAAALAAGLLSSFASSSNVYSVNIVGYVNVPTPINGFFSMANPLIANGGNSATNVFPNPGGALDGCSLYIWATTGLKFDVYVFDSTAATGFADPVFGNPLPTPTLNTGTGFLFNNQIGARTNTFVGQVTGVVTNDPHLIADITIPATPLLQMWASPIPIGGGISSVLQLSNPGGIYNGQQIQVPNIVGGVLTSWTVSTFDDGFVGAPGFGFGNALDTAPAPGGEPVIPIATAFLFVNNATIPVPWHQDIDLGP